MLTAACEASAYAGIGLNILVGTVVLALVFAGQLRARRLARVVDSTLHEWRVRNGFSIDDGVVGDGARPEVRR